MAGRDPRRVQLRSLIARECAASLMNDAKWNRALSELRTSPTRFRIKLLTQPDVSSWDTLVPDSPKNYVELPTLGGPVLCLEVEWLEIDPLERRKVGRLVRDRVIDHSPTLEQTLAALRLPYSKEESMLRIWGHLRKGQAPRFLGSDP